MSSTEKLKDALRKAFGSIEYPGDWCLKGSYEGTEPYLLEEEFKGKTDWMVLEPNFLDQAPGGYASALSFFSDEAFRFYLPAYLIADIDNLLERTEPVFHLTHGLTNKSKKERINSKRYGERTWLEQRCYDFSVFDLSQTNAIIAFLRFKKDYFEAQDDRFELELIEEALNNYWTTTALERFQKL